MRGKTSRRFRVQAFLSFSFFICSIFPQGLSAGLVVDQSKVCQGQEENSRSVTQIDSVRGEADCLWRSAIWDGLPVRWANEQDRKIIVEAYIKRGWKPFFVDSNFELNRAGRVLLRELEELEDEAVDPGPFQMERLRGRLKRLDELKSSARAVAAGMRQGAFGDTRRESPGYAYSTSDAALSRRSLEYFAARFPDMAVHKMAEQLDHGLFQEASAVDIHLVENLIRFAREMNPFSHDGLLKAFGGEVPLAEFLEEIEPTSPHYASLCEALRRYRKLASEFSATVYLGNSTLRLGDEGIYIGRLQERLRQEGFYSGDIHGHFDAATDKAVRSFQAAHLLETDGAVGTRTKYYLNVPYEEKVSMIVESLDLLRTSRTRLHDRFIRINVPQFVLEYYRNKGIEATHHVIVGKSVGKKVKLRGKWVGVNYTPTLSSAIERIVFNPRWYVSDRIRLELEGEAEEDPTYFARNGYVQMSSRYPWGEPRLFQRPGPTNPLGKVKFEFPNAYAVYLHDTPNKRFFERARRDLSHGCIRVENAVQLAEKLLADDGNAAIDKLGNYLAGSRQVFVKLQEAVPIVIEYVPVSSNGAGQIVFCGDPYGLFEWDKDAGTVKRNAAKQMHSILP